MLRALICACLTIGWAWSVVLAQPDFIAPEPLHEAGLTKFWQLPLPLEKDQHLREAYLVDDLLYLGTQDGYVFSVHAPTGVILWLQPVTRSGYPLRRPCHVGDQVVFVTPTDLQTYDRRTGDPVRRHDLRFPAGTGVLADGSRLFVGGLDRRLYALDPVTSFVQWRVLLDGPVGSLPAMQDELVFVASDTGTVYACTRDNRVFRWQFAALDRISADLVAREEGVYVASRDQSLYLLDLNYGQVRWRVRFSGPLYEAPAVTSGLAYQYSPADGLVAVDTSTVGIVEERRRWKLPNGRVALTVHQGRTYILTREQTIAAVDTRTGEVVHNIPAPGFDVGIPAPDAATLFVAAADGRVFCAGPRGLTPPRVEDVLAALRAPRQTQEAASVATAPARRSGPDTRREVDRLATRQRGVPAGGKSKVSRQFQPTAGEESE